MQTEKLTPQQAEALEFIEKEVPRHIAVADVFSSWEPSKERLQKERQDIKNMILINKKILADSKEILSEQNYTKVVAMTAELEELLNNRTQFEMNLIRNSVFTDINLKSIICEIFAHYLDILPESARQQAYTYIDECIAHKKEMYDRVTSDCDTAVATVEKINALYATELLVNLTKAGRGISEITEFGDTHGYIVSPTKSKKYKKKDPSITYLTLTPADKNMTFSRPITLYDRAIIDSIETLENHNTSITATEVYRQMNGGSNITVEKGTIADIESRIDYMRRIMVTVDYTQHMNMNGHPGTYKIEGTLLKLDKVTFSQNGKIVSGYRYNAPSPLFEYAKAVEQLATIPVIMLETKSIQKNSIRAESIKQYLLFRLYTMEHQGETISLETILKEIGEPKPSIDQVKRIRKIIENFLEYWSYGKLRTNSKPANKEILNISPIRGYCVNTVGKKVTSYSVIPKVLASKQEGLAVTRPMTSRNPPND